MEGELYFGGHGNQDTEINRWVVGRETGKGPPMHYRALVVVVVGLPFTFWLITWSLPMTLLMNVAHPSGAYNHTYFI